MKSTCTNSIKRETEAESNRIKATLLARMTKIYSLDVAYREYRAVPRMVVMPRLVANMTMGLDPKSTQSQSIQPARPRPRPDAATVPHRQPSNLVPEMRRRRRPNRICCLIETIDYQLPTSIFDEFFDALTVFKHNKYEYGVVATFLQGWIGLFPRAFGIPGIASRPSQQPPPVVSTCNKSAGASSGSTAATTAATTTAKTLDNNQRLIQRQEKPKPYVLEISSFRDGIARISSSIVSTRNSPWEISCRNGSDVLLD
jgi:hypothetical protein